MNTAKPPEQTKKALGGTWYSKGPSPILDHIDRVNSIISERNPPLYCTHHGRDTKGGCSEGLDAFRFFLKTKTKHKITQSGMNLKVSTVYINYTICLKKNMNASIKIKMPNECWRMIKSNSTSRSTRERNG